MVFNGHVITAPQNICEWTAGVVEVLNPHHRKARLMQNIVLAIFHLVQSQAGGDQACAVVKLPAGPVHAAVFCHRLLAVRQQRTDKQPQHAFN